MDILHLVDRLEELFNESKALPFTRQVMVDEGRFLDIIDQMRVSIPHEVRKAQQTVAQKERILAQAQEEAGRTVTMAREKSDQLLLQQSMVQAAQEMAEGIVDQARGEADEIRRDADQYVLRSLQRLQMELEKLGVQVHNGIQIVQQDLLPPPEPLMSTPVQQPELVESSKR